MKIRNIIVLVIFVFSVPAIAVDYPIISMGVNGGWGENDLSDGFFMRGFLRYSLEAYIPGFQIEAGFAPSFFGALDKEDEKNPDPETELRTTEMKIRDSYATLSGAFHVSSFGSMTVLYFGGGVNFNFIKAKRTVTDKYWDPIGEEYQEKEIDSSELLILNQPGFHALGGIRFLLGTFGSFDIEARQTFVNVDKNEWEADVRDQYGNKSWDTVTVNLGLTLFIF